MLHNGKYTYAYFFWILSTIKMTFGQILVCSITKLSSIFLAQYFRVETISRHFFILLNWQYSEIWPFLTVDIYHFWMSLIQLFKKIKHWNLDKIDYWVIGAGCWIKKHLELIPFLQICQKIPNSYFPCLYLSIDQDWWFHE